MSAFKPSNNLLTDTILFEAIAQIREKSDYRREVESYVLEQNGLASVRQLSEDKKRLFTRIVDAIIAEGVDEIDPSMYVMNEAYGKAIREATPDERRSAAYVRNAALMAAKTDPRTGGQKPGMDISPELERNKRIVDKMGDQKRIHQTFQDAGEIRKRVRDIQHATTKPPTEQHEDHSPLDRSDYRTPNTPKERAQLKAGQKLHDKLTEPGSVLGRHKKKDVEEGVLGDIWRHEVPAGRTREAVKKVPRAMADIVTRGAQNLGKIGYERTKDAIRTVGGAVAGAVRGEKVGPRRLGEDYDIFEEMIMESEAKAHEAFRRMVSTNPKDNPVRARPDGGRFRKGTRPAGTHYDRVFTKADLEDPYPNNPFSRKGDEAVTHRVTRMLGRIASRHGDDSARRAIKHVDEHPDSMHYLIPNSVRTKYGAPRHQDVK